IENLAQAFAATSVEENGLRPKTLNEAALRKLKAYRWPGNVRELQNVIERSVLLSAAGEIGADEILLPEEEEAQHPQHSFSPGMTVSDAEKLLIMKTLDFTGQNRTRAAEMLGI